MRVGETVSAGIVPLLSYLGAGSILANAVTVPCLRHRRRLGQRSMVRARFHLDRTWPGTAPRPQSLRPGARRLPVGLWRSPTHRHPGPRRDPAGRWLGRSTGRPRTARSSVAARIIIDATGRQARIARRLGAERVVTDRLVGLVCHLDLPERTSRTDHPGGNRPRGLVVHRTAAAGQSGRGADDGCRPVARPWHQHRGGFPGGAIRHAPCRGPPERRPCLERTARLSGRKPRPAASPAAQAGSPPAMPPAPSIRWPRWASAMR